MFITTYKFQLDFSFDSENLVEFNCKMIAGDLFF